LTDPSDDGAEGVDTSKASSLLIPPPVVIYTVSESEHILNGIPTVVVVLANERLFLSLASIANNDADVVIAA
jgi:hypothetical protein